MQILTRSHHRLIHISQLHINMKTFIFKVSLICLTMLIDYVSSIPSYFMDEMCGQTIDMNAKQIESGHLLLRRPESTGIRNRNCALIIRSPNGKQLVFKFQGMYLETPFGCDRDYVEIFEGSYNTSRSLIGKHCGSLPPMVDFNTIGSYALIAFSRYTTFFHDQFSLTFTAYHRGVCNNDEFACNNGRCIHGDLRCDEFDNCGDESDFCALSTGGIVGIALACVIVIVILAVIAAFLFLKKRKSTNQQSRIDFHSSLRHSKAPRGINWFQRSVSNQHQPSSYLHRHDSHKICLLDPSELESVHNNEQQYNHSRRFRIERECPDIITYAEPRERQKTTFVNDKLDAKTSTQVYTGSNDLHSSLIPEPPISQVPEVWINTSDNDMNKTYSYTRSLDRKIQHNSEILNDPTVWIRGSNKDNVYDNDNYYTYNTRSLNRKCKNESADDPAIWIRRTNNDDFDDNDDHYTYNAQSFNRKFSGRLVPDPAVWIKEKNNEGDIAIEQRNFNKQHGHGEADGEIHRIYNGQSSWPRTPRNELFESERHYGFTQSLDGKLHRKSLNTDDPEVWIRIPKDDRTTERNGRYGYTKSLYHGSGTSNGKDMWARQTFDGGFRGEDRHYGYSLPLKKNKLSTAHHDPAVRFTEGMNGLEHPNGHTRSLDRRTPSHLRHVDVTGLARGYSFSTYRGMKPYVISFRSYPSPPPVGYNDAVYNSQQPSKSAMKTSSGKYVCNDKALYSRDLQQDEIYYPNIYTNIYR